VTLASCTCPTFNRPHKHEGLYQSFCSQTYEPRELVVLDGSKDPSPFFTTLKDDRVRYFHEPEAPREGGVTRIGAIRNRLTQLAKGEIIQAIDDDDHYGPSFLSEMISRLGDADVVKLAVWRLLHGQDIYLWDQRIIGGPAFALRGNVVEPTSMDDMSPEEATAFRDAWQLGFMWSAVFRRAVALEIPFPEEGTEDVSWMRSLVAAGKKIVMVADAPHLALHVVEPNPAHAEGGSPHFPQVKLRSAAAKRMMGAGIAAMTELPQGEKISIEPGKTYQVLAAIKDSHSTKSIETRAAHWGLRLTEAKDNVSPADYNVDAPPDGYRLVYFVGVGDKAVTLPWQAPKFARAIGESSHVVRAWVGAGSPPDEDDAYVLRILIGVGAPQETLGPKGRFVEKVGEGMSPEDAAVSEYDPERYKGRPPPHRCSAASSSQIAKQLDPRWSYASSPSQLPAGAKKSYVEVQTPTAKKKIPTWTAGSSLILQCPYTGQYFKFTKGPAQLGAGAPRIGAGDFNSDLAGDPTGFGGAWGTIQQQLSLEGADATTIQAAKDYFDASYQGLVSQLPGNIEGPGGVLDSAKQFVLAGITDAGAVDQVGGLLAAAASGAPPSQLLQTFTGTMIGLAVSAGAVSAGLGAAIVGAIAIVGQLLKGAGLFSSSPGFGVCSATYPLQPAWVVGCTPIFTNSGPAKPGTANWIHFPNPADSVDAAWFAAQPPPSGMFSWRGVQVGFPPGILVSPISFTWPAVVAMDPTMSLLLRVAVSLADPVVAAFHSAFVAGYKLNQEYPLNGLQPQPDWQVLLHTLRLWNKAHLNTGSAPYAIDPSDTSKNGALLSFEASLVSQLRSNVPTTDPIWGARGLPIFYTGPRKPVGGVTKVAGSIKPTSTGLKIAGVAAGSAVAAAIAIGIYAYASEQSYLDACKSILRAVQDQTSKSGRLLADASPHRLLLK